MSFIEWLKGDNNISLAKSEYMWGTRHIVVFCLATFFATFFATILRNKSERTKRIFYTVCASIALFVEILQRAVKIYFMEEYTVESVAKAIIPLYLCSIAVWSMIASVYSKKQSYIDFATVITLLATLAYFIAPDAGMKWKYLTFDVLYSIGSHAFGFAVSVSAILCDFAKFEFKNYYKTLIGFALVVAYGLLTSLLIFPGTDYVFILNNPLEFTWLVPYWCIYICFLVLWVTVIYFGKFLYRKIFKKNHH